MQLTMERLKYDTHALCRCVNAVSCKAANHILGGFSNTNEIPRNEWVKLEASSGSGYIFIDQEGNAGRYQRDRPEGGSSENITTIKTELDNKHVIWMISELSQLLSQLESGVTVTIQGTKDKISLADPDIEVLQLLQRMLAATEAACSEGYNEHVVSTIARELQESIMNTENRNPSILTNGIVEKASKIGEMHQLFAADGMLTSWFLFYGDACMKLKQYFAKSNNDKNANFQFLRYITLGLAGIVNEPQSLLAMFVNRLVDENMYPIASDLGWQYLEMGEDYLNRALDSNDLEAFGANLYTSALFLYSARQIFQNLSKNASDNIKTYIEEYRKAEKVADEKTVRVTHSLGNIVLDRTGERFKFHQHQIKTERAKSGEKGAAQKIFEIIEMWYFYPRYYSEILSGNY